MNRSNNTIITSSIFLFLFLTLATLWSMGQKQEEPTPSVSTRDFEALERQEEADQCQAFQQWFYKAYKAYYQSPKTMHVIEADDDHGNRRYKIRFPTDTQYITIESYHHSPLPLGAATSSHLQAMVNRLKMAGEPVDSMVRLSFTLQRTVYPGKGKKAGRLLDQYQDIIAKMQDGSISYYTYEGGMFRCKRVQVERVSNEKTKVFSYQGQQWLLDHTIEITRH